MTLYHGIITQFYLSHVKIHDTYENNKLKSYIYHVCVIFFCYPIVLPVIVKNQGTKVLKINKHKIICYTIDISLKSTKEHHESGLKCSVYCFITSIGIRCIFTTFRMI